MTRQTCTDDRSTDRRRLRGPPSFAGRLALAIWMLMFTALGVVLLRADTVSR